MCVGGGGGGGGGYPCGGLLQKEGTYTKGKKMTEAMGRQRTPRGPDVRHSQRESRRQTCFFTFPSDKSDMSCHDGVKEGRKPYLGCVLPPSSRIIIKLSYG